MFSAQHVSVSLACSAQQAYEYIIDPHNLPAWASGLSSHIEQVDGKWVADSPMGKVSVEFAATNPFGVLDHEVTLPDGEKVSNPFRVIPNGKGCELIFSVLHRPGVSEQEFAADVRHVEKDLQTLKSLLEKS